MITHSDYETIKGDAPETAYRLQKEKCAKLAEEFKSGLDKAYVQKFIDLYDALCDQNDLMNTLFYKAGFKKAVDTLVNGLI